MNECKPLPPPPPPPRSRPPSLIAPEDINGQVSSSQVFAREDAMPARALAAWGELRLATRRSREATACTGYVS